jgi:hypothetical protein
MSHYNRVNLGQNDIELFKRQLGVIENCVIQSF